MFSFQVNFSKHVSVWNRPTMDIGDLCLQSLSIDEYLPDEIKRYKHVMEIRNWSKKLQYSKDLEGHPFHIESSFFDIKTREFDAIWRLFFYPNGTEVAGVGFLSAFLCMESQEILGRKFVNVMIKFSLMNGEGNVIVDECPKVNEFIRLNHTGNVIYDNLVDAENDYTIRKNDNRFYLLL